jgi:hypothetical protein
MVPVTVPRSPGWISDVQRRARGRVPGGRLPSNFEYAGKVYDGPKWTSELAAKYPNGVRFTEDGFPNFSPYATHTVTFDPTFKGNHSTDFAEANRMAGLEETPLDSTWHHTQPRSTDEC